MEVFHVGPETRLWLMLAGRVLLSGLLTALLGLEREIRNKDAGLRTYALVGLASGLIMVVSQYGFTDLVGPYVNVDPSRVAAQVATGVGFLGAGLIFVRRDVVKGLTTAAGLWLSSAIGLAAGAGMIFMAVVATGCGLMIMYGLERIERQLLGSKKDTVSLEVVCQDKVGVLAHISTIVAECGFNIDSVELRRDVGEGLVAIHFVLDDSADMAPLLSKLAEEPLVTSIPPVRVTSGKRSSGKIAKGKAEKPKDAQKT